MELTRTTELTTKKSCQSKISTFFKAPKNLATSAHTPSTRSKQVRDNSNNEMQRKAGTGTSVSIPPVHINRKRLAPSPPSSPPPPPPPWLVRRGKKPRGRTPRAEPSSKGKDARTSKDHSRSKRKRAEPQPLPRKKKGSPRYDAPKPQDPDSGDPIDWSKD